MYISKITILACAFSISLNLSALAAATFAPSETLSNGLPLEVPVFDESFAATLDELVRLPYSENAWMGSFIPGLGQMSMGEPLRGGLFMGGFVAAIPAGFGLGSVLLPGLWPAPQSNGTFLSGLDLRSINAGILGALALAGGVYIWNLADAYALNIEKNSQPNQRVGFSPDGQLTWSHLF